MILFGFILLGMSLGNLVMTLLLLAFYTGGGADAAGMMQQLLENPESVAYGWYALMVVQGAVHLSTFLVPPVLYNLWIEKLPLNPWQVRPAPDAGDLLLVLAITVVVIPVVSVTAEWNGNISLPGFLKGVETWMRNKEDSLAELTGKYMNFGTWPQLAVACGVMAVIPAVGEEVLFRGMLQKKLESHLGSPHAAIWISAAVFSAIHVQFYGFVPRMLLGALFGYIYFWTGRLSLAVFSHLVNNGLIVLMVYLYRLKLVDIDIEDNSSVPPSLALASLAAAAMLSGWLYRKYRTSEAVS